MTIKLIIRSAHNTCMQAIRQFYTTENVRQIINVFVLIKINIFHEYFKHRSERSNKTNDEIIKDDLNKRPHVELNYIDEIEVYI